MPASRNDPPQPRRKREPQPPPPTLGSLLGRDPDWWWVICEGCRRQRAMKTAKAIEFAGAETTTVEFMRRLRCENCGRKGQKLQHPSWTDSQTGWQPYPGDDYVHLPGSR